MAPAKPMRRFGAHMSIAGGLHLAFEATRKAGCDGMQIFVWMILETPQGTAPAAGTTIA